MALFILSFFTPRLFASRAGAYPVFKEPLGASFRRLAELHGLSLLSVLCGVKFAAYSLQMPAYFMVLHERGQVQDDSPGMTT